MRLADEAAALRSARSAAVGPTGETSMDALGSSLVRGGLGYMAPDARRVEQAEQIAAMQRGLEMRAQLLGPTADRPELLDEAIGASRSMGLPSVGMPTAPVRPMASPNPAAPPMEQSPAPWPEWFRFGPRSTPDAVTAAAEMGMPYASQAARAARDEAMTERALRTAGYLQSQDIARERLDLARQAAGTRQQEAEQGMRLAEQGMRLRQQEAELSRRLGPAYEQVVRILPDRLEAAETAARGVHTIDIMEALLEGGMAGGRRGQIAAGMARLGIPVTEGMTEAAMFQALNSSLAGSMRVDIVGPGVASERDMAILQQAVGGGSTDRNAAAGLLRKFRGDLSTAIGNYNEQRRRAAQVDPSVGVLFREVEVPRRGGQRRPQEGATPAAAPSRVRGIRPRGAAAGR